ncbi:exo-beta-N-acetylmuramidase NamZ family protein [Alkalitalea saponilacus]|uniref:Uncharacterized conserved protein YbbC, DUF1343 family n=1 Tax=Alkalitalea saponilacus TaxID=889453 RepID=A0A1T5HRX2_9BACT|nr:DUF1343 domain-containing protein [Alkalitalea saponilacus]SKC23444.1 Uncharacterized conserved protein YbbC, DUF1343 family [Alkalitalea saponilacus]
MINYRMRGTLIFIITLLFATPLASQVKTGVEVLRNRQFDVLKNQRVGLITNPTGVDRHLKSTVDIFHEAPEVNMAALFAPEHGVRGDYYAGDHVADARDEKTGIPVFSLHGHTRKPTPEMLKNIDVLVYDIQDIGSRSYTYISTLGLAMEAAAENNIKMVILDRPNPLGGLKFEGPLVENEFISFVSQYPVTYVHGFTVGELAIFLNKEQLLKNGVQCELYVVEMEGWNREMTFMETGLPWVPSSPHIPHAETAWFYPVSGILGELYVMNIGVGYTLPFQMFAAEWINAPRLAENLNNLNIPGVIFRPVHYRPYYSVSQGTLIHGVQVHITDISEVPLSLIQFYVLQEAYALHPDKNVFEMCAPARLDMFDKVVGTDAVRILFQQRFLVEDILDLWNREAVSFGKYVERYFLY